jgi:LDH2 family malate/lactate/ureidoglycolate dehydrogenase
MTDTAVLTVAELHERVEAIFRKAGLSVEQAGAITRVIVAGERDACKSHGIYRIEGALRTIKAGKVKPDAVPELLPQDSPAIVKVTAKSGFANPAFELGLPVLAESARANGLAALVINDAVHFSALWTEVEALTQLGLAGMAMCPSYAAVAPAGGKRPLLGTNPFAFGWPRRGALPYVFDFATSVAARGEIELHRRDGRQLPAGWAIDADGQPTTDPEAALGGAMLCDQTSSEALASLGTTTLFPTHGELILAFSPQAFAMHRSGDPMAHAEMLFEAILGQGSRLPSQRRFAARSKAATDGIGLTSLEAEQLERFLKLGLDAV